MIENNIVISVSGGNVKGVFTNNPDAKIYLVDYDNLEADPSEDCGESLRIGSIEEFRESVNEDSMSFSGIKKLLERINSRMEG